EQPLASDGSLLLSFVLDFKTNKQQGLGHFRISVCGADAKAAVETGTGTPEMVVRALAKLHESRSEKQTAALLTWYRHRDAQWQALNAIVEQHAKHEPQPKLVK